MSRYEYRWSTTGPADSTGAGYERLSRQVAVALGYRHDMDEAPRVLASGRGPVAEKIIELAEKHEIPVHRDTDLAQVLSKVKLGDYIPAELFEAVAEILVFIYKLNRQYSG